MKIEESLYKDGLMINPNFLEYKMPLSVDMAPIRVELVGSDDPEGPFGAKEAGEGPVSPTAPSIVNAIHHATGVWIKELPVNPETLVKAINNKEQNPRG